MLRTREQLQLDLQLGQVALKRLLRRAAVKGGGGGASAPARTRRPVRLRKGFLLCWHSTYLSQALFIQAFGSKSLSEKSVRSAMAHSGRPW